MSWVEALELLALGWLILQQVRITHFIDEQREREIEKELDVLDDCD